ncbi:MAG: Flp pilus assembly protein CpaB [Actinobacteria bacterium]|nr:Flp pilus assembly protein CpaB [Actinomycetota bacterium]
MRVRITLLILAIFLGAISVILVIFYINNIRSSVEEDVEKVEVLVAVQNIPKETPVEVIIQNDYIITQPIPKKYLAGGVLTSLDSYKGYVVAAPINEGEQITSTNFIKPEDLGLTFIIPGEMVAISIPVNDVIGVSNLINIGDKVNVIATFQPTQDELTVDLAETDTPLEDYGSESEESIETEEGVEFEEEILDLTEETICKEITKILLWNVEVLYIGTRTTANQEPTQDGEFMGSQTKSDESTKITTVTLAVTPEESEKLVFSEEMGTVWLALVPITGIDEEETPGRTLDNIFK